MRSLSERATKRPSAIGALLRGVDQLLSAAEPSKENNPNFAQDKSEQRLLAEYRRKKEDGSTTPIVISPPAIGIPRCQSNDSSASRLDEVGEDEEMTILNASTFEALLVFAPDVNDAFPSMSPSMSKTGSSGLSTGSAGLNTASPKHSLLPPDAVGMAQQQSLSQTMKFLGELRTHERHVSRSFQSAVDQLGEKERKIKQVFMMSDAAQNEELDLEEFTIAMKKLELTADSLGKSIQDAFEEIACKRKISDEDGPLGIERYVDIYAFRKFILSLDAEEATPMDYFASKQPSPTGGVSGLPTLAESTSEAMSMVSEEDFADMPQPPKLMSNHSSFLRDLQMDIENMSVEPHDSDDTVREGWKLGSKIEVYSRAMEKY